MTTLALPIRSTSLERWRYQDRDLPPETVVLEAKNLCCAVYRSDDDRHDLLGWLWQVFGEHRRVLEELYLETRRWGAEPVVVQVMGKRSIQYQAVDKERTILHFNDRVLVPGELADVWNNTMHTLGYAVETYIAPQHLSLLPASPTDGATWGTSRYAFQWTKGHNQRLQYKRRRAI